MVFVFWQIFFDIERVDSVLSVIFSSVVACLDQKKG